MTFLATEQRNLSNQLAGSDPRRALEIARQIGDPWFRCQALSQVARYWPHDDYERLLAEAVKAATAQHDNVYNEVAVSAWPIRAYLERGSPSPAKRLLEQYTAKASSVENMGGRSEALLLLLHAARPFEDRLWQPVFWALVDSAEPALGWRQRRNVRLAASMVSADYPEMVKQALKRLSDNKTITAIERDIQDKKHEQPRPFFWLE